MAAISSLKRFPSGVYPKIDLGEASILQPNDYFLIVETGRQRYYVSMDELREFIKSSKGN